MMTYTDLDPLAVAQLHNELTVVDEPVAAGEVKVLVLPVDWVVTAHLVQPGRVQVSLQDISKLAYRTYPD